MHCGVLLDDAAAGTPQRFIWLPAADPEAPTDAPGEPIQPQWKLPQWPPADYRGLVTMKVPAEIASEIEAVRLCRLRDNGSAEALAGHGMACREKVAAILAVLDGRAALNVEDWSLAGIIGGVSDGTRAGAQAAIETDRARTNVGRGKAQGEREATAEETRFEHTMERVCRAVENYLIVQARLPSAPEWFPASELRNKGLANRDRKHFEDALDRLKAAGQIEISEGEHQGRPSRKVRTVVRGHADSVRGGVKIRE